MHRLNVGFSNFIQPRSTHPFCLYLSETHKILHQCCLKQKNAPNFDELVSVLSKVGEGLTLLGKLLVYEQKIRPLNLALLNLRAALESYGKIVPPETGEAYFEFFERMYLGTKILHEDRLDPDLDADMSEHKRGFYSHVPWKDLIYIGCYSWDLGSRTRSEVLQHIAPEIKNIADYIQQIIHRETQGWGTQDASPSGLSFPNINVFGAFIRDHCNLCVIERTLANIEKSKSGGHQRRLVTFGQLRAFQIVGECSKNLSPSLKSFSKGKFWRNLEKIRDLLAHSERNITKQRLEELFDDDSLAFVETGFGYTHTFFGNFFLELNGLAPFFGDLKVFPGMDGL